MPQSFIILLRNWKEFWWMKYTKDLFNKIYKKIWITFYSKDILSNDHDQKNTTDSGWFLIL